MRRKKVVGSIPIVCRRNKIEIRFSAFFAVCHCASWQSHCANWQKVEAFECTDL